VAVLISLFSVGLKLGLPLSSRDWLLPVRLAFVSMALTVALIAVVGVLGLGLAPGAAILLGAILAPTDPVLATAVQVESSGDRDRLRFSLTGEGGLNDGTAFPFVMLGLGLLGLHDLGTAGWRWLAVDVVWATAGGLLIGSALGALIGRLVVYLRTRHQESVGLDEFLALGLIALAYGVAVVGHAYGFLSVFAAGLALRRVKEQSGMIHLTAAEVSGYRDGQTDSEPVWVRLFGNDALHPRIWQLGPVFSVTSAPASSPVLCGVADCERNRRPRVVAFALLFEVERQVGWQVAADLQ
jgi:NhaP-type Na+/H+ or K+/H+ antiporter